MTRLCQTCSAPLDRRGSTSYRNVGRWPKWCSPECRALAHRAPPTELNCVECGRSFEGRAPRRYCSPGCQRAAANRTASARRQPAPPRTIACLHCGTTVTFSGPAVRTKYCSKVCSVRAAASARDHAKRSRQVTAGPLGKLARVDRLTIAERDGWTCHLCAEPVDPALAHPGYGTLDHLTPIAAGGLHEPRNVALAHLRCNVRRGTNPVATAPYAGSIELSIRPAGTGSIYLARRSGRWTGYFSVAGRKRYVPGFNTAAEAEAAFNAIAIGAR